MDSSASASVELYIKYMQSDMSIADFYFENNIYPSGSSWSASRDSDINSDYDSDSSSDSKRSNDNNSYMSSDSDSCRSSDSDSYISSDSKSNNDRNRDDDNRNQERNHQPSTMTDANTAILSPPPIPRYRYVLQEQQLDSLAYYYGYFKLDASSSMAPMASYLRGACRLNFWLTTGTVGSYLENPRQGKTQLFRRDVDMYGAEAIFRYPRVHTGRGYQNRHGGCGYGWRGPCRYGDRCYRADCWFDH